GGGPRASDRIPLPLRQVARRGGRRGDRPCGGARPRDRRGRRHRPCRTVLMLTEINFDGIVGPSHNYAGLSLGNLAATSNAGLASRPREAALEGVAKMRANLALGLVQGILPPHE